MGWCGRPIPTPDHTSASCSCTGSWRMHCVRHLLFACSLFVEWSVALVGARPVCALPRVGIGMRNLPEFIVAYIAVTSIGGVAVLLNAWWTAKVPPWHLFLFCVL